MRFAEGRRAIAVEPQHFSERRDAVGALPGLAGDASGAPVFPALLQARAAQDIFGHGAKESDPAWFPMPTGQSVGLVHDLPGAAEVVERIVREARAVLDALGRLPR